MPPYVSVPPGWTTQAGKRCCSARLARWALPAWRPGAGSLLAGVLPDLAIDLVFLLVHHALLAAGDEAAAHRAVTIGALNYKSVASILENHLDRASPAAESASVHHHPNVRGPGYFH